MIYIYVCTYVHNCLKVVYTAVSICGCAHSNVVRFAGEEKAVYDQ